MVDVIAIIVIFTLCCAVNKVSKSKETKRKIVGAARYRMMNA